MLATHGRPRHLLVSAWLALALAAAAATAAAAAPDPLEAADITGVRLGGSASSRQGRLEVQAGADLWFDSVCQTGEPDDPDALPRVVCRQLGFGGGHRLGLYPEEAGSNVLTGRLVCTGNETTLAECSFEPTTEYGCDDPESEASYVGVVCQGAAQVQALRLAGGPSPAEGRLEVQLADGRWGTVCESLGPDKQALADVSCRQLGYSDDGALWRANAFYGGGDAPPLLGILECSGEEESLDECSVALEPDSCPGPAFGVACNGSSAVADVRLSGGPSAAEGQLEVLLNGSWAGVCHTAWPEDFIPAAQAACRQLGRGGGAVRARGFYGTRCGRRCPPLKMAEVVCGGTEEGLNDCSFSGAGGDGTSCMAEDSVGIACDGAQTLSEVRLANGSTAFEGRLEVLVNSRADPQWGTVSGMAAAALPAQVVCRQLGLGGGVLRGGNIYGAGQVPEAIENLHCSGQEDSLSECSWGASSWGNMHSEDYAVACQGAQTITGLRLATASSSAGGPEGRLEVQVNGSWGTVCDWEAWFSPKAAGVACAELGFSAEAAELLAGAKYGASDALPIVIAHVDCAGGEASLNECSFSANDPGNPTCTHDGDVGLKCQPKTGSSRRLQGAGSWRRLFRA